MITEDALKEAIAEVQGKRDPNRQDCMMLAAFYVIQDRLFPPESDVMPAGYSGMGPPENDSPSLLGESGGAVGEYGETDFLKTISGKSAERCWLIMDDLMNTLWAINPRLYAGVMRDLTS